MPLIGILTSAGIFALSLQQPYVQADGALPTEWIILAVWALLGAVFWRVARTRREQSSPTERRKFVLGSTDPDRSQSS